MKPTSRDIDNRDVANNPIPHIDLAHLNLKTFNKIQNKFVKFQREYLKTVSICNIVHDYWCTYGATVLIRSGWQKLWHEGPSPKCLDSEENSKP